MSKIEPGCLAITRGLMTPENNDRLVTVLRKYVAGEILPGHPSAYFMDGGFNTWVIQALGAPFLMRGGEFAVTVRATTERCLRRIDNPGDDEADLLLAPLPQQDKVPA